MRVAVVRHDAFARFRAVSRFVPSWAAHRWRRLDPLTRRLWPRILSAAPFGFLLGVMFAIWVKPGVQSLQQSADLYLLSTIAQTLAAILGLLVTGILVVSQLLTGLSRRMTVDLLAPKNYLYLLINVAAILWPIWALARPPDVHNLKIALSLATVSLLTLIPYLHALVDSALPRRLLVRVVAETYQQMKARQPMPVGGFLKLEELLLRAVERGDAAEIGEVVGVWTDLTLGAGHYSFSDREAIVERLDMIVQPMLNNPRTARAIVLSLGAAAVRVATLPSSSAGETGTLDWLRRKVCNSLEAAIRQTMHEKDPRVVQVATEGVDRLSRYALTTIRNRTAKVPFMELYTLQKLADEACRANVWSVAAEAAAGVVGLAEVGLDHELPGFKPGHLLIWTRGFLRGSGSLARESEILFNCLSNFEYAARHSSRTKLARFAAALALEVRPSWLATDDEVDA